MGRIDVEARKSSLVDAMSSVIHDRGVSAVSLRTIAAAGGVAVGSLRHVFPARATLLVYAAELMTDRVSERIQNIPFGSDRLEYAVTVLLQLIPCTEETRAEMEINVALVAESGADPDLVTARDRAHTALFSLCRSLLRSLDEKTGEKAVDDEARRLQIFVNGLAFHYFQLYPAGDIEWGKGLLRAELSR